MGRGVVLHATVIDLQFGALFAAFVCNSIIFAAPKGHVIVCAMCVIS